MRLADASVVSLVTGLPPLPPFTQSNFSVGPIELMPMYEAARIAKQRRKRSSDADKDGSSIDKVDAVDTLDLPGGGVIDLSSDDDDSSSYDGLGFFESGDDDVLELVSAQSQLCATAADPRQRPWGEGTAHRDVGSASLHDQKTKPPRGQDSVALSADAAPAAHGCCICRAAMAHGSPFYDCPSCGAVSHVCCLADHMIVHALPSKTLSPAAVVSCDGPTELLDRLIPSQPAPCPACSEPLTWQAVVLRVRSRAPALLVLQPSVATKKRNRKGSAPRLQETQQDFDPDL